jgi:hypothetical protein
MTFVLDCTAVMHILEVMHNTEENMMGAQDASVTQRQPQAENVALVPLDLWGIAHISGYEAEAELMRKLDGRAS